MKSTTHPHAGNKQLRFPIKRKKNPQFFPPAGLQGQLCPAQAALAFAASKALTALSFRSSPLRFSHRAVSPPAPSVCTPHVAAAPHQTPNRGRLRDRRVLDARRALSFARKAGRPRHRCRRRQREKCFPLVGFQARETLV